MKLPPRPSGNVRTVMAAGTAGLLVVAGVGLVLVRSGGDPGPTPAEAARVLQSVSATVSGDGTITALDGTVVAIDSRGGSRTEDEEYDPEDVADQLPVRVLTSYRTADGAGTDLDDLEGHDGRVEIALTVENTTVEPQELTYDVAGTQRRQSALVGVPLTVVASTDLDDLDPAAVETTGTADTTTNGVLSRTEDGRTQVQWATLLAPPQLGSSATLRLVVDTEDFSPPDFDLSVQPGLVTDPSVGALVDAAFNPSSSEELELQQRTIALIGEVNTVLARAGESVSDVRRTLSSSAETIGVKTVEDLRSSTTSIAASMSSLGQTVDSLGQDLAATVEATGSTSAQQLQASLQQIATLLGDTRQTVPTVAVRGEGCETSVPLPSRASSLYGSLLSVSAQLDGYARANQQCRSVVQQRLVDTIGTATADDDCPVLQPGEQAASVTCTLFEVAREFDGIADDLSDQRDAVIAAITSMPYAELLESVQGVEATDTDPAQPGLEDLTARVEAAIATVRGPQGLDESKAQLDAVDEALTDFADDLGAQHDDAEDRRDAIGDGSEDGTLAKEILDVRAEVCDITGGDLLDINAVSARMVGAFCGLPASPVGSSVFARLQDERSAWDGVARATDLEDTSAGVGKQVADLRLAADRLRVALVTGQAQLDADGNETGRTGGVDRLVGSLATAADGLDEIAASIVRDVQTIKEQVGTEAEPGAAITSIDDAFAQAEQGVSGKLDQVVAEESVRLVEQTARDSADIGKAFERSASGLTGAGAQVRADGKATVQSQQRDLVATQGEAAAALTRSVRGGLAAIAESVNGSTRDADAASRLLQADLANVLLDIGTREVDGSGLLGAMTTGAATAGTADEQLALATDTTTSYAGVRSGSIAGLYLRQAQADAALQRQADQPAFELDLPAGVQHRTVYTFHLRTGE